VPITHAVDDRGFYYLVEKSQGKAKEKLSKAVQDHNESLSQALRTVRIRLSSMRQTKDIKETIAVIDDVLSTPS
jgi:hypothetical protein